MLNGKGYRFRTTIDLEQLTAKSYTLSFECSSHVLVIEHGSSLLPNVISFVCLFEWLVFLVCFADCFSSVFLRALRLKRISFQNILSTWPTSIVIV